MDCFFTAKTYHMYKISFDCILEGYEKALFALGATAVGSDFVFNTGYILCDSLDIIDELPSNLSTKLSAVTKR